MKPTVICFFLLCSLLYFSSCKKNIAKEYSGNFYFNTEASSYFGEASNDSIIYFYGSINANSKTTLKIEYGPILMTPSSNTSVAKIYVEGLIYPTVDANGNFTYPDYLAKDLHYYFMEGLMITEMSILL